MASLWEKMKNTGNTTKLKGEIVLLEREKKIRKEKFGRDLFDLLNSEKGGSVFAVKTPTVFHAKEEFVREPFERYRRDIEQLMLEKHSHRQEVDRLQINRDRALPASTNREHLDKAAKWIASQSAESKHTAQMVLLDRQINQRKGAFGVELFDSLFNDSLSNESSGRGVKNVFSNQLSKLSNREKEIEDCVEEVKNDIANIDRKIKDRLNEIRILGDIL